MQRWRLGVAAAGLALLVWLPLGLAGVPLDTPDGFLHLGWAVAWVRQLQGGWLWPTWSDLPWAGAGSSALLLYPPLFRLLVGVPHWAGVPVDHALAVGLLVVLLLNAGGALLLARAWLRPGPWRWWLLASAGLNPYLLVNLYVRGAWPEALAQAELWWLALGLLGLARRAGWGIPLAGLSLAAVILSNWNAALLTGLAWALAGLLLLRDPGLRGWLISAGLGLGLAAPFWLPALQALAQVRPPMPAGLLPGEFFFAGPADWRSFADLLWVQAATITLLLVLRWLGWGWQGLRRHHPSGPLAAWGLALALLGLGLMLPLGETVYQLLPPLQRIQFPWRWLGPASFGAILWLASPGSLTASPLASKAPARRLALWLSGLAAAGLWFDSLYRFRENVLGHAPSPQERQALRQLLACDPLEPCPKGVAELPKGGELAKRFAALPDGRIALAGVPDYSPAGIPESSWSKRLQTFWLPTWPQPAWAQFSGQGSVQLMGRSPRQRWLLVQATSPGTLRLMQWAQPAWRVQWRPAGGGQQAWSRPLPAGGRDEAGWISVPLAAGRWEVALHYGQDAQAKMESQPAR
jgi:hypothetical protein